MERSRRCAACGKPFTPRPNVPNQRYCSCPSCQRERRYRWHEERLASDPDYQANQRHARSAWQGRHQNYWKEYRKSHPEYCERNRIQQRSRNERNSKNKIATCDEPRTQPITDGVYRLRLMAPSMIATTDEYVVRILVISRATSRSS